MDGIDLVRNALKKLVSSNLGYTYQKPRYIWGQSLSDREEAAISNLPDSLNLPSGLQVPDGDLVGAQWFMIDFHPLDGNPIK